MLSGTSDLPQAAGACGQLTGFLAEARAVCGEAFVQDGAAIEPRYLQPARYAAGQAAALVRPGHRDE